MTLIDKKAPNLSMILSASEHEKPQVIDRLLVCGLPGRRLSAAIEFVRQAFVNATGQCNVINANTLTDALARDLETDDGPMLLWADSPDQGVVRWIRSTGTSVLLVDQPFEEVGLEFMMSREASLSDSARVLALARIGWWQLAELPTATIIDVSHGVVTGLAAVLDQPELVGMKLPDCTDADCEAVPDTGLKSAGFDSFAKLGAFYGASSGAEASTLMLPLHLLFDGAPPHPPLSGSIDLTGPVRALSFGPFLYLPKGQWMLRFTFEASMNRSGNFLMFDILVDHEASCVTEFSLPHDGQFAFDCRFDVRDPWSTFEFRSHLRRGAIEGLFKPLSLEVTRI